MRVATVLTVLVCLGLLVYPGFRIETANSQQPDPRPLTWAQQKIIELRGKTHRCQVELGRPRSPVAERIVIGARYQQWVRRLWRTRARFYCDAARQLRDPVRAIRAVFGSQASNAVAVARCETGGTFSVHAQNGQYLGLFQMGSYARSRYGHSYTPLGQARAAYAYFRDAGWSPWACAYIVGIL